MHHKLGGLKTKNIFLTVLKVGKSKIKMLANSVPGGNPLPGFQMATFCCVLTGKREKEVISLLSLLMRALIPLMRASLMTELLHKGPNSQYHYIVD